MLNYVKKRSRKKDGVVTEASVENTSKHTRRLYWSIYVLIIVGDESFVLQSYPDCFDRRRSMFWSKLSSHPKVELFLLSSTTCLETSNISSIMLPLEVSLKRCNVRRRVLDTSLRVNSTIIWSNEQDNIWITRFLICFTRTVSNHHFCILFQWYLCRRTDAIQLENDVLDVMDSNTFEFVYQMDSVSDSDPYGDRSIESNSFEMILSRISRRIQFDIRKMSTIIFDIMKWSYLWQH